jgi:hypothetical protein
MDDIDELHRAGLEAREQLHAPGLDQIAQILAGLIWQPTLREVLVALDMRATATTETAERRCRAREAVADLRHDPRKS